MSTMLSAEDYDYSELTHSYMSVFYSQTFSEFLNTTQTGFAHTSSGTELSLLVKAILTSLTFCTIQLTMFCFFRNIFKSLYQPRCYCVPLEERITPLPNGFINWIMPTLSHNIHYYMSLGLDTYFFVRFINVLLLYFSVIGTMNILVLIPTNYAGSSKEFAATGLDEFSLSNISASKIRFLNAHFVMSLITIGFFHWLIVYEMESVIKIRQTYLLSREHRASPAAKTVLIANVPNDLLSVEALTSAFSVIPGGVKRIWLVDKYGKVSMQAKIAQLSVEILEMAELQYMKKYYRKIGYSRYEHYTDTSQLRPRFYAPISITACLPWTEIHFHIHLPGIFRVFALQIPVDKSEWCIEQIQNSKAILQQEKLMLTNDSTGKFNSAFIQFHTQAGAYVAHQVLLSNNFGSMDKTVIETHPRDIQWNNLARGSQTKVLLERYFITILCISLIILYIIPVSFIGLVSQIPLLTKLLPFLQWIHNLPEEARECISSILPSLMLSLLTEIMMTMFRFLSYFKGKLTGAEIETDLQKWYFSFLFIQQFLVVTISSSITVIFKQIVDQPTSIPVMLATNLPKAATFFFHFIAVKALAFCGNNFLRVDQLVLRNTIYRWWDKTPRQKLKRVTRLLKIKWGTIYPVYSVYASIGLAYNIISPFISVFIVFILFLALLYYKYSLRYIYSHVNESETYGRLYPRALLHLYSGIYCLECCLIGIFFLSKDANDEFPMKVHGWIMCLILMATIFGNVTIYNRYYKFFSYLPIIHDKVDEDDDTEEADANLHMLYVHPDFKYDIPKVWLPFDPQGVAYQEIERLRVVDIDGVVTPGSKVSFSMCNRFMDMVVTDAPPDYK